MAAFRRTMLRALKQLRRGPPPAARQPTAQRTFTTGSTGGSQGDLESALLLKNKIESAGVKELRSSADLIAEHCDRTQEILDQVDERHDKVTRDMCNLTLRYFCTGVVLGFIQYTIHSYYYKKAEFELWDERRLEEENGRNGRNT